MKRTLSLGFLALLSASALSDQLWRAEGGGATVSLSYSFLHDVGVEVTGVKETSTSVDTMENPVSFGITHGSDLSLVSTQGYFKNFNGGALRFSGGFTLHTSKKDVSIRDFTLVPNGRFPWENMMLRASGNEVAFDLKSVRAYFDRPKHELILQGIDMYMTPDFATKLGKPSLQGQYIGMLTLKASVVQTGGDAVDNYVDHGGGNGIGNDSTNDVRLLTMSSLTYQGRTGTYPNGMNGYSMSTTSCNAGTNNIDWYEAMDTRHPYIAMNLYRVNNGRFEQIGQSWLKHGWYATNQSSSGCQPCTHPGTGTKLGPGCSDTYGVGNNSDRHDLGARSEANPFTGTWKCQGSYFSNYVADCVRRNDGSEFSGNPVAHRLEVADQDLLPAGSTYVFEAYYLTSSDPNKYNNIGSCTANIVYTSSNYWRSSDTSGMLQGIALNRWGDIRNTALPRAEGDAVVAVAVTAIGGNMYHYEYAVYNHDIDRQIREFSIPVPDSATVSNIGFHDIDRDASTDWPGVRENGKITWATDTIGQNSNANSLKFSSLFNFRFDCNLPPVDTFCAMGLYRPGSVDALTCLVRGPQQAVFPSSFLITEGTLLSGGRPDLFFAEGHRLNFLCQTATGRGQIQFSGLALSASPGAMAFLTETSATRTGLTETTEAFNFTSNDWQTIDSHEAGLSDISTLSAISSPSQFVNAGDLSMKSRITWEPFNDETPSQDGWGLRVDEARWQF